MLKIKDRAKAPNYIEGDTAHTFLIWGTIGLGKTYTGRGGTAHTLLMGEQLGWGHHTAYKEKIYMVGWVGGWMGG